MPGVFLSHSSADKPFVTKLAIDLVNQCIPVWLDSWEMDTGDTLLARINSGIDDSTLLIVVISAHSVASSWVKKELSGALTREQQLGRTFILPVKISECQVPPKIRGRFHADFSRSYHEPLERLAASLKKAGADRIVIPPEKQIVPLVFTNGLHLNEVLFRKRIDALLPHLPEGFRFESHQFLVSPDERYTELRRRMLTRIDNVVNDSYYSHALETALHETYTWVTEQEERLLTGISTIVNGMALGRTSQRGSYETACYWFAKDIRSVLFSLMWECQNPQSGDVLDSYPDAQRHPTADAEDAAQFFGIARARRCLVGPRKGFDSRYFGVWIDAASFAGRNVPDVGDVEADYLFSTSEYEKYVIPQMVNNHLTIPEDPLTWDFDDCIVGLS
jgi:hypothetical protein